LLVELLLEVGSGIGVAFFALQGFAR